MKIIYYYQTFVGLSNLLSKENIVATHIHVSSIHFGLTAESQPYIHLNNYPPDNSMYDDLWKELKEAKDRGLKIVLMIGGAGGGFESLFSDKYNDYIQLLFNTIDNHSDIISGIDLDVEENVGLSNIKKLIRDIKTKYSDLSLSMAPVQSSLQYDTPGMGGFNYKELYNSDVGKYIDYFCVQFYFSFSEMAYDSCVKNGYPPEKIVMGMLSGVDYESAKIEVYDVSHKYEDKFGGIFVWEYYDAPPYGSKNPSYWSVDMYNEINKKIYKTMSKWQKIKYMFGF